MTTARISKNLRRFFMHGMVLSTLQMRIEYTHFFNNEFALNFNKALLTFLWNFQHISGMYGARLSFQSIHNFILHTLLFIFYF